MCFVAGPSNHNFLASSSLVQDSNMSAPDRVAVTLHEGVGVTLLALASVFVGLRCFVSLRGPQHKLRIDDCEFLILGCTACMRTADSSRVLYLRLVLHDSLVRCESCSNSR